MQVLSSRDPNKSLVNVLQICKLVQLNIETVTFYWRKYAFHLSPPVFHLFSLYIVSSFFVCLFVFLAVVVAVCQFYPSQSHIHHEMPCRLFYGNCHLLASVRWVLSLSLSSMKAQHPLKYQWGQFLLVSVRLMSFLLTLSWGPWWLVCPLDPQ